MRLSTRARYALQTMVAVAKMSNDNQPVSLAKVAKHTRISHRYLEKLVSALKKASPAAEKKVHRLFTLVEPPDEEIFQIVDLVRELGGVEYARKKAVEFAERAQGALEGLPQGPALASLRDSITYVVDRDR